MRWESRGQGSKEDCSQSYKLSEEKWPKTLSIIHSEPTLFISSVRLPCVHACELTSVMSNSLWPQKCSLPCSSVYGIIQARILQWVVVPSSKGPSRPRNWNHTTCKSCIAGGFFTTKPLGKEPCGYCWVFQICWHDECSILTASSFRAWNSSAWIPSPPLTL